MDRTPRFFFKDENISAKKIVIDDDQVKHITKSLRLKSGDNVILFNGKDKKFLAKITSTTKRMVEFSILESLELNISKVDITLGLCLPKLNKIDEIIKYLTQLGISRIIPIESRYSEIKKESTIKKYDRWKRLVVESCKQSERDILMEIDHPIDFEDLDEFEDFDLKIIASAKSDTKDASSLLSYKEDENIGSIIYLIGPEGGFSEQELDFADNNNFHRYKFHNNILRTETAAIYFGSILYYLFN